MVSGWMEPIRAPELNDSEKAPRPSFDPTNLFIMNYLPCKAQHLQPSMYSPQQPTAQNVHTAQHVDTVQYGQASMGILSSV
jgi:hypothetical protein